MPCIVVILIQHVPKWWYAHWCVFFWYGCIKFRSFLYTWLLLEGFFFHKMACCMFSTKPLPENLYHKRWVTAKWTIKNKIWSNSNQELTIFLSKINSKMLCPLLTHWRYVSLALTNGYGPTIWSVTSMTDTPPAADTAGIWTSWKHWRGWGSTYYSKVYSIKCARSFIVVCALEV